MKQYVLLKAEEYMGSLGDRIYFRTKVGAKLDHHYGVQGMETWDPMHAAARMAIGARKMPAFR